MQEKKFKTTEEHKEQEDTKKDANGRQLEKKCQQSLGEYFRDHSRRKGKG